MITLIVVFVVVSVAVFAYGLGSGWFAAWRRDRTGRRDQ